MRIAGNFLILFSLYMLSWVFLKPTLEELKYAYNNVLGRSYVVVDDLDLEPKIQMPSKQKTSPTAGLLSGILARNTVEPLIPKDPYFSILIPKIGANENVIAEVDPGNEEEYLFALQNGVAHAAGSAFPGQNQHVYLFAHSTNTFTNVSRYNALFYLLYKLENGDEVNVYYEGVRHIYTVTGKTIVDPSEVSYLTRATESEFLTLQTCWPPGTTAQRLLIFAEPKR